MVPKSLELPDEYVARLALRTCRESYQHRSSSQSEHSMPFVHVRALSARYLQAVRAAAHVPLLPLGREELFFGLVLRL